MKTMLAIVCCCLVAACHRAPRTAEELQKSLPHEYRGELHLQGEQQGRKIVVEPHDFTVVDPHRLEFNHVRYQLFAGNEAAGAGDAPIRGTISAPGLVIHVDEIGEGGDVESADALKVGTFEGKLSGDLQTMDAKWQTGFGQGVTLKVTAVP